MITQRKQAEADLRRLRVDAADTGSRLDRFLAHRLDESRNRVQRWIRDGRVAIDDVQAARPSIQLQEDQIVTCRAPVLGDEGPLQVQAGPLDVLWEDESLIVVDKAAGVAVHPGAGRAEQTLANYLLHDYPEIRAVGHPRRPGIVHRLDLGTTGILVVARNPRSYRRLAGAFAERRVRKLYLAIVYGSPEPQSGEIESAITRHPRERKRMTVTSQGGRAALTLYRTLATDGALAFLELDIRTGRTHQIRVHLKSRGHPLVGDPTYGEARWKSFAPHLRPILRDFPRPALHAWRLFLAHPESGQEVCFEAPVPEDIRDLWRGATGSEPPPLPPPLGRRG